MEWVLGCGQNNFGTGFIVLFIKIAILELWVLLGFIAQSYAFDLVTTNLPNHGWYIDIGGRWNDYNLSELNGYLKYYQNPKFNNGGSYKLDLWYFYSSRLSCSAGMEYIDNTRKGISSYRPPYPPGQTLDYTFRLKAYIPNFELRYFFSLPHVDYYVSLGQMFCVAKFRKRLADQSLVGQSYYLQNREFPGYGIGFSVASGMLKEISSNIKINIQAGYRYLKSGDLEYDKGVPLDYYRKNIAVDFSGAFCEFTVLYRIAK